jgi:hypothetical protein
MYINNHAIYNSIYELIHNFFKFHLKLIHELRGFAPIGIMEQWSNGMMGLKEFYLQYSSIPFFHVDGINRLPLKDS